jgi:hypothetical protein
MKVRDLIRTVPGAPGSSNASSRPEFRLQEAHVVPVCHHCFGVHSAKQSARPFCN